MLVVGTPAEIIFVTTITVNHVRGCIEAVSVVIFRIGDTCY